jgi:hypothetical protein
MHFIQRFILDPKRTLTRSRSATDATRFLRHIQARISPAIKCDAPYDESSANIKRHKNACRRHHHTSNVDQRIRSQSVPIYRISRQAIKSMKNIERNLACITFVLV